MKRVYLEKLSKDELVDKILALQAHNTQLKNVINKSSDEDSIKNSIFTIQKSFDFSKYTSRHILLKLLYLGWDYKGYVTQEDTTSTIEHHLFKALIKTCLIKDRSTSNYHRCGRTDKGVSSFSQTISIDVRSKLSKENQDDLNNEINYCSILNKVLPSDIQCIAWCPVSENFSARFDCNSRTYKYFFPRGQLNIEKMKKAAEYIVGTHDFRNFCKMDVANGVTEFIRRIEEVNINMFDTTVADSAYSLYVISIKGKAFLWHQIRCIMSILLLIGQNKEQPELIKQLLNIEETPRKPDYGLASEIPLNLYSCDYAVSLNWQYDEDNCKHLMQKLKSTWTTHAVKTTMIKGMINDLEDLEHSLNHKEDDVSNNNTLIDTLLQGSKTRKYIPVMKRQKCESLEQRVKSYRKKCKMDTEN